MTPSILCINTGGIGDLHGLRARRLTEHLDADCIYLDVDREMSRWANARVLWQQLQDHPWDLVYQEGTGIAGGLPLILASLRNGQPYVVSSGDPVGGFFKTVKGPAYGAVFEQYERWLYRASAGFVGWTPYLTGAALKMGAPRGVTIEGAVDTHIFTSYPAVQRKELKGRYGLDPSHMVCGVVGSLQWTPRQAYCYGLELVEMLPYLAREDISVLIVGDGDGRAQLEARVPPSMRSRVVFTGRVPEDEVVDTLNAMDVGFITQTLDDLGLYRLTTKLPEYLAAGLPVAMSPNPGYFDYAQNAGWALPAHHPANPAFHRACAAWLDTLSWDAIEKRRAIAPELAEKYFDYKVVRPRFEAFIEQVLRETKDDRSES